LIFAKATENTIKSIVSKVGDLPSVPAVVTAAIGLTANLESDIADIERILSMDQSLVAKVLKLSNSPHYGRAKEVQTLQEAVLVLGFNAVRSLVLASSAHSMYTDSKTGDMGYKLWLHSLSTAIASRQIAEHINHPDKEEAFIAGLLHDIGKLILIQKAGDWYEWIVKEVESEGKSFRRVESRVLSFNHCDVGSLLLTQWSFPNNLIQAVDKHHRPPVFGRGETPPLAQIVNLANYMAKNMGVGFEDQHVHNLSELKSAIVMNLPLDTLLAISEVAQERFEAEARMLDAALDS